MIIISNTLFLFGREAEQMLVKERSLIDQEHLIVEMFFFFFFAKYLRGIFTSLLIPSEAVAWAIDTEKKHHEVLCGLINEKQNLRNFLFVAPADGGRWEIFSRRNILRWEATFVDELIRIASLNACERSFSISRYSNHWRKGRVAVESLEARWILIEIKSLE